MLVRLTCRSSNQHRGGIVVGGDKGDVVTTVVVVGGDGSGVVAGNVIADHSAGNVVTVVVGGEGVGVGGCWSGIVVVSVGMVVRGLRIRSQLLASSRCIWYCQSLLL